MSNSRSGERPDLQDLVAYMQGRGSEALRAQVLKRLDEDESYLELMMDLVPMLREAGELADPDAIPDVKPAIRPLVSPIAAAVDAPLPPPIAASPQVVPFPESPSRRRTAAISLLAVMIPAAVAIWIATNSSRSLTADLARHLSPENEMVLDNSDSWGGGPMRGGAEDICGSEPVACFDAGAQLLDLQVAVRQNWKERANIRLANLATTLGKKTFSLYFPTLAEVSDGQLIELEAMKKPVETGALKLFEEQVLMDGLQEGACLRAALLAAKSDDRAFFEGRKVRKLCGEFIDEAHWKADEKVLTDLYDDKRAFFADPR